jgi:hypothetical protein
MMGPRQNAPGGGGSPGRAPRPSFVLRPRRTSEGITGRCRLRVVQGAAWGPLFPDSDHRRDIGEERGTRPEGRERGAARLGSARLGRGPGAAGGAAPGDRWPEARPGSPPRTRGRPARRRYTAEQANALWEVAAERTAAAGIPVLGNVDLGYTDPMLTLPIGARARLDAGGHAFRLLEPASTPV